MKRKVFYSALAVLVFGLFFALVWTTVRVLAQDFRVLRPVVGILAVVISAVLTGYVFSRAVKEEKPQPERSFEVRSQKPDGAVARAKEV